MTETVGAYVARARREGFQPVIRRSAFESYLGCSEWEGGGYGDNAAFGELVHRCIARGWALCYAMQRDYFDADYVPDLLASTYGLNANGLHPDRLMEAQELLQQFFTSHLADLDVMYRVEYTLTHDTPSILYTGTCDRLDRVDDGDPDDPPTRLRLQEYKTEWPPRVRPPDPEEGEDESNPFRHRFQVQSYAAFAFLEHPYVEEIEAEVDYIRARAAPHKFLFKREASLQWWEMIRSVISERLTASGGKPTGGESCDYCAARLRCGAAVQAVKNAPVNAKAAERVFGQQVRLEAALKETRAALRVWFKDRPPAVIGGYEVGYLKPRDERLQLYDNDPGVLTQQLVEHNQDPDTVIEQRVHLDRIHRRVQRALVEEGAGEWVGGEPYFGSRKSTG